MFHVSFSIQVFGLNVTNTFISRAIEQDKITREVLVVLDLDNVANLDFFPHLFLKPVSSPDKNLPIVFLVVT